MSGYEFSINFFYFINNAFVLLITNLFPITLHITFEYLNLTESGSKSPNDNCMERRIGTRIDLEKKKHRRGMKVTRDSYYYLLI
jgi:hypothetical protein